MTDRSRWRETGVVAAVLLVASLVPVPFGRHPEFGRVGPDKALHLLGHWWFAATLADALDAEGVDGGLAGVLAVLVSAGYGLLVGRLQERIPGREPETADFVAGAVGSVFGTALWLWRDGGTASDCG